MTLSQRLTMAAEILREVAETAAGADRFALRSAADELEAKAQAVEQSDAAPLSRTGDSGAHAGVLYH